ncbi:MAG: LON peptidase substrate-binding domain-containing protein [Deltaproteobacteria bacterium]|nr:LON peptidase substrate-binding domain-containing protein [Deltaproteobacteria bacterium]
MMREAKDASQQKLMKRGPFPLFPLPALVALPGQEVALHFFEPRYRALGRDLVALREGGHARPELILAEVRPGEDARRNDCLLFEIASLGHVVDHVVNRDGTIDVLIDVKERVRIEESERGDLPYRRAWVETLEDVVVESPALYATEASLRAYAAELQAIERMFNGRGGVRLDGGVGALADRLADRYFQNFPKLRRQVLEALDVLTRAEIVLEYLAQIVNAVHEAQRKTH